MQGVEAVDALLESTPDTPSYMIAIHENKIKRVPLVEAVAQVRVFEEIPESARVELTNCTADTRSCSCY